LRGRKKDRDIEGEIERNRLRSIETDRELE